MTRTELIFRLQTLSIKVSDTFSANYKQQRVKAAIYVETKIKPAEQILKHSVGALAYMKFISKDKC